MAVLTGNHPKLAENMFLADLPGFKNPFFFNFKKKFFLAHPITQLHLLLRLTLIKNLEVQSRLIAGVSLSSNRVRALSVAVTELKLLNTGARAIVSASSASGVHGY